MHSASGSSNNSNSRNVSYMEAVRHSSVNSGDIPVITGTDDVQVRSGLQKVLQVFITHSANVFLLEPEESSVLLDEQVNHHQETHSFGWKWEWDYGCLFHYVIIMVQHTSLWSPLFFVMHLITIFFLCFRSTCVKEFWIFTATWSWTTTLSNKHGQYTQFLMSSVYSQR